MRERYMHELEKIKTKILNVSNKVTNGIEEITQAVINFDKEHAARIVDYDDEIDELFVETEEFCVEIIAREQPVAQDLRLILSSISIVTDLERCGDLTVNIAKVIINAKTLVIDQEILLIYRELGVLCKKIVEEATLSFMNEDLAKAEAIDQMDDAIDDLNRKIAKTLLKSKEGRDVEDVVRQIMMSRFYERIADHAVNVSRQVKFFLTGNFEGNR